LLGHIETMVALQRGIVKEEMAAKQYSQKHEKKFKQNSEIVPSIQNLLSFQPGNGIIITVSSWKRFRERFQRK